jgi:uncharacterized membrane protein YccC
MSWLSAIWRSGWPLHSLRTAAAGTASLAAATLLRLPEGYWAAITTIIVMQSTLGAAWTTSKQRLIGTALGTVLGGLVASRLEPGILLFGASILFLGLVCGALRLDLSAYRFAGITLAIVMLVVRSQPPWLIAAHRFVEVSLGIAVALVLTALWPAREPLPFGSARASSPAAREP